MGGCISLVAMAAISACGGAQNDSVDAAHSFAFRGQLRIDGARFGVDPRDDDEIAREARSMHIPVTPGGRSDGAPAAEPASPSAPPIATAPAPDPAPTPAPAPPPRLRPAPRRR